MGLLDNVMGSNEVPTRAQWDELMTLNKALHGIATRWPLAQA